jgi:hypothetical protein
MNNNQRREIAEEYIDLHKAPISEWMATRTRNDPLLIIYYQMLESSRVDEMDPGLRTIEIQAEEHKNNRSDFLYFDNELEELS